MICANRTRSRLLWAAAALSAGAAILAGASPHSAQPSSALSSDTAARTFAGIRAFTKPSRDATIGFSITTQVTEVIVKGGQAVKKGEPLVRGNGSEDAALLRLQKSRADSTLPTDKAQVALDLADIEFKRVQDNFNRGAATQQELDRVRLSRENARIDLETANWERQQEQLGYERQKARMDRYELTAPFDGHVDTIAVDVGQSVSESDKVVRVVNVDLLWIDVPAPMQDPVTLALKEQDAAWIMLEVAGRYRVVRGHVAEVSPVADASSRTRRVRVEFTNATGEDRVVAGEPAWVRFTEPDQALLDRLGLASTR